MTITTRFSATATASAATSIVVPLGGTPNVGDLAVVFLGVDNQIVTHQPGYASGQLTNWTQVHSFQCPNSTNNTLSTWIHSWNAADSGSSVTFTFSPAPSLGLGDKDVSTTNAVAVAVVLANQASWLESTSQGVLDKSPTINTNALKKAAELVLTAGYSPGVTTFSDSDSGASTVQSVTTATGLGQTLYAFSSPSTAVGYKHTLTAGAYGDLQTQSVTISSALPLYIAPVLQEADASGTRLMFRYRPDKGYTVFNNSGTWTAVRYQTTDQVSAATQVFSGTSVIASTDRTNILNSGVGGEFRATS